jgi:ADP-ribose pyrophosphatase
LAEGRDVNDNWRTTESVVLAANKWLRLERRTVVSPAGTRLDDWYYVAQPDFVNVLVRTVAGDFLVLEVDKYACGSASLSLVGGLVDLGEAPLDSARRELLEETGFVADRWIELASYVVDPNRGCGTAHFFIADGAWRRQAAAAPDCEQLSERVLNRDELEAAILSGRFLSLAWAACALQGLLWLRAHDTTHSDHHTLPTDQPTR